MLKEQPHPANRKYLERENCENVREVYQSLQTSGLEKFTYSWISSLLHDLIQVIHHLERLPEAAFRNMIEVIDGLSEARNELRLSRFLFDLEEIHPVHRLLMRNRAVLRGKRIVRKMLLVWPADPSS